MTNDKTTTIKEYELWRNKLLKSLEKCQSNNITIVGNWTLKNIISHLTGWAKYQTNLIEDILKSKEPQKCNDIEKFNAENVAKETGKKFEEIINNYKNASDNLITIYSKLPNNLWSKQVWPNIKVTPKKLLNIEIRHIAKTHLPQITKSVHTLFESRDN